MIFEDFFLTKIIQNGRHYARFLLRNSYFWWVRKFFIINCMLLILCPRHCSPTYSEGKQDILQYFVSKSQKIEIFPLTCMLFYPPKWNRTEPYTMLHLTLIIDHVLFFIDLTFLLMWRFYWFDDFIDVTFFIDLYTLWVRGQLTLTFLSDFYSEIKTKNFMKPAYKANYQLWKLYVKIIYKPKL